MNKIASFLKTSGFDINKLKIKKLPDSMDFNWFAGIYKPVKNFEAYYDGKLITKKLKFENFRGNRGDLTIRLKDDFEVKNPLPRPWVNYVKMTTTEIKNIFKEMME